MLENSGIQACTSYEELIPLDHHSRPSFARASFSVCLSSVHAPYLRASTLWPYYSSSPTWLSSLGTLTSRCRWFSYHYQWLICVCSSATSSPSASALPSALILAMVLQNSFIDQTSILRAMACLWKSQGLVSIKVTKRNVPTQKIGNTSTLEPYCHKYD